jgi:alpha-L-rhamnosidase
MSISLSRVSFEHHRTALGIHESAPRVSWRFEGNVIDWEQQSYDLEIDRDDNGVPKLYNVESDNSLYVPWPDQPLASAESARVRVKAHGTQGQPSTDWSDWSSVETGLLSASDWGDAIPIAADRETERDAPKRPVHFRKDFDIDGNITSARLYITALGVYEAEINGQRVGDYVLAPGWQSYNHRHVYDTYDVTELVSSGDNAIGVLVGEGWYAGRLGWDGGERNIYGDTLGVQALLVTTTDDGAKHAVATGEDWHASLGPIITSEIYDGEKYDARLELSEGWSSAGFNEADWMGVNELSPIKGDLVPADGPPVRKIEEVRPVSITTSPSGNTILDFGQNLVGWLRLNVSGTESTNITLHHAEVLEDGELSLRPLRNATAEDVLVLADDKPKIWEPRFTFHGFRYAQVDGLDASSLDVSNITAIVVHSDMERTGWFECSNPLLNKFHQNVLWSMK